MTQEILKQIKREVYQNLSEILSGFLAMVLMLVLAHRILGGYSDNIVQYLSLTTIGCGLILITGFEKRGRIFDRFVSMFVLFFLALSFMFL